MKTRVCLKYFVHDCRLLTETFCSIESVFCIIPGSYESARFFTLSLEFTVFCDHRTKIWSNFQYVNVGRSKERKSKTPS